ncbi:hypothetical protein IPA_07500 [Ignicoccus pacificus DSM 13166]|uniref:PIN domain-containing protein n=1 Tax=Ignicoccus pacificus DSM 13166 TaxID=940294 RepID=A0A977K9X2_9CREN|nr:hypothetical protein IPA_07500 [Ignicoccus pacificus DSM 13166]
MIVLDVSVLIDALFNKDPKRYEKALEFLRYIEDLPLYAPRIMEVELIAVSRRLGYKAEREKLLKLSKKFKLLKEDDIFNLAIYVADNIHPRAVDAYYIATAIATNSIIVANDKLLVKNSRQSGIEAYYLIEEYNKTINRIKELRKNLKG